MTLTGRRCKTGVPLAQLVERRSHNPEVVSSILTGGTITFRKRQAVGTQIALSCLLVVFLRTGLLCIIIVIFMSLCYSFLDRVKTRILPSTRLTPSNKGKANHQSLLNSNVGDLR